MLGMPIQVIGPAAMVAVSFTAVAWTVASSRQSSGGRTPSGRDQRQAALSSSAVDRVILPVIRAAGRGVRRISPVGWIDSLERRILVAGTPGIWTMERALAFKLILGVGGVIGGLMWSGGALTVGVILISAAMGAFGYALPDILLYGKGRERQQIIRKELPDTLDQLTISVEAGLGFDAALSRVSTAGDGPLADELQRLLGEVKVGVPRSEALRHLLDRTDVSELRQFVLALQQAEQYGLPVARVLRIQAGELRVKRRQRAEEEAMKIPVKIVFPLVMCIFPSLFVVLLGPAFIRVVRTLF